MKIFHYTLLAFLLINQNLLQAENKPLSAKQFLKIVQNPPGSKTWAQLIGKITHERRNSIKKEENLYFAIKFTKEQTFAEISVGKSESYSVGQSYLSDSKVTVIPAKGSPYNPSILQNMGVRPDDLTMSVLFWKLLNELKETSISMQSCRVFLLESPDKTETAKVYISKKYFFPLKVEWTKTKEKKTYRTLEVKSYRKVNSLWLVDEIILSGPGWRTKIIFNTCKAGLQKNGIPKDLFKNIKY